MIGRDAVIQEPLAMQLTKHLEHRERCDELSSAYRWWMNSRMKATSCLESDVLCLFVLSHPRGTAVYHANQVSTSGVVFDRRRCFTACEEPGVLLSSSKPRSGMDSVSSTGTSFDLTGKWLSRAAHGDSCTIKASVSASSGQVAGSPSGKSDYACSSDVFTRMKRMKNTSPAPMESCCLRTKVKSDARPNRYQRRHNSAASW
ncbi:hypothetical protein P3T76_001312 [Phytophthora citrophthora]|uniref:Uncharacterized protein n=1 Tax=Phytophthora citrophthora TaxID=4793 RepID=A0AAD9LUD4_9STRA|nr:hypothetical protein P3T76_001312 [Phytophthora citrophthora]